MFEVLFIDLDDTVLDFKKAESIAIAKTLRAFSLEPTIEVCRRYSQINQIHWERLERGELTRAQVLVGRFATLFAEYGIAVDPEACSRQYTENLGIGHYFLPGAKEALEALAGEYRLYLASNGTAKVQQARLKSADIGHLFRDIFISQDIGTNKPDKEYFARCFARIPDFDPAKTMIVGDSLTSDILGGKNAGIATCWVNPGHKPYKENIKPDYQIEALSELPELLKRISTG